MSTSPHLVTIEFDGDGFPRYWMTCDAPPDADCRIRFDCGCENWDHKGVTGAGVPWHSSEGMDTPCEGRYEPDWCRIAEWFTEGEGEENLTGEVSFRVHETWDHHAVGYTYTVVDEDGQP